MRSLLPLGVSLFGLWVCLGDVRAQCTVDWLPVAGLPGTNGVVRAATMWDPDGPGPATPVLVIAGEFTMAGTAVAKNIAAFDPATGTWAALGPGLARPIGSLATLPNGQLVAARSGYVFDDAVAPLVQRWDGTSWMATGAFGFSIVNAIVGMANGDIVAVGSLNFPGVLASTARWDGSTWSPIAAQAVVTSVASLANGDVVIAGSFTSVSGVAANRIARWDGSAWSPLGTGVDGAVKALAVDASGNLVAAGEFTSAGGSSANGVALWTSGVWVPLGAGQAGVTRLLTMPNGDVITAGNDVQRWDGVTWTPLGPGQIGPALALAVLPNGTIVAGGAFHAGATTSATDFDYLAAWNGTAWGGLTPGGPNGVVSALLALPDGDLIAGGRFTLAGATQVHGLARWHAGTWSAVAPDLPFAPLALARLPNGDLAAAGEGLAWSAGSTTRIGIWNGSTWSLTSATFQAQGGVCRSLAVLPNGDLVVAGWFGDVGGTVGVGISRWDGSSWSQPTGSSLFAGTVLGGCEVLAAMPNGDLIAGGDIVVAGSVPVNHIARWDGATWSPLGTGVDGNVFAILPLSDDVFLCGGAFQQAGGVSVANLAMWDGLGWVALPGTDGPVRSLAQLPNGDILIGGAFTTFAGVPANGVARLDPSGLGAGFGVGLGGAATPVCNAVAVSGNEVFVAGQFLQAGGMGSPYLARLGTDCPAQSSSFGTGCSGSAGPNVLATVALPFAGGTFVAEGTGMPASSVALAVTGLATMSTPLSSLLPFGVPGCTLLVQPDILGFVVPTAGVARSTLGFPNQPNMIGLVFHHQLTPLEYDPALGFLAWTGTNGLTLTVGGF